MAINRNIVPQNWTKMFNINIEKNKDIVNDLFLTFTAYTPPEIKVTNIAKSNLYDVKSAQAIESYSFLQPNDNIIERINHVYAENPSKVLEGLSGFRELVGKGTGFGLQVSSGGTQGSIIEEPFLYVKTDRRTFSINLPLFMYSDMDRDIYDPIDFFRRYSYPSQFVKNQDGSEKPVQGGGIKFPYVFKISGGVFRLNTNEVESFFSLNDMDIDYNPDVKFLKRGFPTQAVLTLNFTEITQMYANKFPKIKIASKYQPTRVEGVEADEVKVELINRVSKLSDNSSPILKGLKNNIKNTINSFTSIADLDPAHLLEISGLIKQSTLTRPVTNVVSDIQEELGNEITRVLKESKIRKKITSLIDLPADHLDEVKKLLKKSRI